MNPTWESDGVQLYLGDALEVLPTLDSVDAVITDPPYDKDVLPVLETAGNVLVFCKPENQWPGAWDERLFWIKTPSTKNYARNCGRFVEMILVEKASTFNRLHWSQMVGVYDDRLVWPPVHPHEKPIALLERLCRIYTNRGDTVLDPFMGSGTTGVACVKTGREFIGIEIDEGYFNSAVKRISEA